MGEGGLELRLAGFSTIRWSPESINLAGISRFGILVRVDRFYPISTRPVEKPLEKSIDVHPVVEGPNACAQSDSARAAAPTNEVSVTVSATLS